MSGKATMAALRAAAALSLCGSLLLSTAAARPPSGAAGDCFEEHLASGVRKVVVETPQPPLVTWRRTPAVYRTLSRRRLVSPAHEVVEDLPAEYAVVARYSLEPGAARMVRTPAVYRTIRMRSLVSPAHLAWRRGGGASFVNRGGGGEAVIPTGDVLCRILVPARYLSVTRRVLVSPAGSRVVKGPAHRVLCYVKTLRRPARRVVRHIAAVYRCETVRVLVTPARCEKILTPRPPKKVERLEPVGPRRTTWRRLDCARAHAGGVPGASGGGVPSAAAAREAPPPSAPAKAPAPVPAPPAAAHAPPPQPPPFGRLSQ